MKLKYLLLILLFSFLTISCAPPKISIQVLSPAKIPQVSSLKRIAVLDFKNDKVGVSGKIESNINKKMFNGKPYFTLLDRNNIDNIMKEQKISVLQDEEKSIELGKILGAEALISGEISAAGKDDQNYSSPRSRCEEYSSKKKRCVRYYYYTVTCTDRTISLSVNIRVSDVQKSKVIYSKTFTRQDRSESCGFGSLTGEFAGLNMMANSIANEFVNKIIPYYHSFDVILLEDPIIDYSSEQEDLLENSIEFMKVNNLKKAQSLLEKLFQTTGGKSLVAAYNLGVVSEGLGDYDEAKTYYQIADKLQIKPIKVVNEAVVRIEVIIKENKQALQQINAKN